MADDTTPEQVQPVLPEQEGATTESAQNASVAPAAPSAPPGRYVRCPICEGSGEEEPGEGEARTCRCTACQVRFRNPRPSLGRIRELRAARFTGALRRVPSPQHRRDRAVALEIMKGYHDLVSGKPAPLNAFDKRVLEIGCGVGFRLREFERYGWRALGVETAPEALVYARATMVEVLEQDLEDVPVRRGPFHLIVLDEVLGECGDPRQVASTILGCLAPKGAVCVTAPVNDAGEPALPEGAIYGFSEDGLRRLFMECGADQPRVAYLDGLLLAWFRPKKDTA